jgi:hypothetical protein
MYLGAFPPRRGGNRALRSNSSVLHSQALRDFRSNPSRGPGADTGHKRKPAKSLRDFAGRFAPHAAGLRSKARSNRRPAAARQRCTQHTSFAEAAKRKQTWHATYHPYFVFLTSHVTQEE